MPTVPKTSIKRRRKIVYHDGKYIYITRVEKKFVGSIYRCPCGAQGTENELRLHDCPKAHSPLPPRLGTK